MNQHFDAANPVHPAWDTVYEPKPKAKMNKQTGELTGILVFGEDTCCILPKFPGEKYRIKAGAQASIASWQLALMVFENGNSTLLAMVDYDAARNALTPYLLDQNNRDMLVKAMSRQEMEQLYDNIKKNLK